MKSRLALSFVAGSALVAGCDFLALPTVDDACALDATQIVTGKDAAAQSGFWECPEGAVLSAYEFAIYSQEFRRSPLESIT